MSFLYFGPFGSSDRESDMHISRIVCDCLEHGLKLVHLHFGYKVMDDDEQSLRIRLCSSMTYT